MAQIAAPSVEALGLGARLVDEVDRHGDRARMLLDDPLDPPAVAEFLRFVVEMEDDARAALGRGLECERRDGERTLAVGRPAPGVRLARPARVDHDVVGDHERGIEADAELADQRLGLLARVLGGQLVEKSLGAGAGDGAEARGQVLARHADAVVGDGQRLLVGIERDGDDERPALDQLGPGDRLVAQFFAGVGGVGDEFADKDFPVGIDRMDHQMQQARNVGLEALGLGGFVRRGLGVGGQMGPRWQ